MAPVKHLKSVCACMFAIHIVISCSFCSFIFSGSKWLRTALCSSTLSSYIVLYILLYL